MKAFENTPDYRNMVKAAKNQWVDRVPLYDHIVDGAVMSEITGNDPYELMGSANKADCREGTRQYWDFWKRMGYDTASMEFSFCEILEGNGCLGGNGEGCIKTREDFELYPWDGIVDRYIQTHEPLIQMFAAACPPGMKLIGGVGNGVFESVQDIIGYVNLCFIRADDEELYADIFRKMGQMQLQVWDWLLAHYGDLFCVARFGDDLGFKTQTLLAPEDIRQHIIPTYRNIISRVHQKKKPFLLHSCGAIFAVMDGLINDARIDAKHSNEDSIAHFTVWVDRYGDRIGNFGGIDTDVICRESPDVIQAYVTDCLNSVKGKGGIAFGSGNSIPDYAPVEGYLAMNHAVRNWRNDRVL